MPVIESVLLDRKDLPPAGAGETPIVGVAPAIGNAIFDATGKRLRSLPMAPAGVPAAKAGAALFKRGMLVYRSPLHARLRGE